MKRGGGSYFSYSRLLLKNYLLKNENEKKVDCEEKSQKMRS